MIIKKIIFCLNIFFAVLGIILLASCNQDRGNLNADDIAALKQKYDTAAFNYFYETVYHEDNCPGKIAYLAKWNSNPKVRVIGHVGNQEMSYVKSVITELNALNLPVQLAIAQDGDSAAIEMFFGNVNEVASYIGLKKLIDEKVDTSSHFGLCRSESIDGNLTKNRIGIRFTDSDTAAQGRRAVVLEELVQSLGIIGDSYNYPSSLFFQNQNPRKHFTQLDKQILSLLYEAAIPSGYPRSAFEKDFGDALYVTDSDEKLEKHLQKYPATIRNGMEITDCFNGNVLLKHPKEVSIFLKGNFAPNDSAIVQEAAARLSAVSPNLKLAIEQPGDNEPDFGIVMNLTESKQQKPPTQLSNQVIAGRNCMHPKIIKNRVSISVSGSARSDSLRAHSLIHALYFSLVPIPINKERAEGLHTIGNNGISFNKHYLQLLHLLYSSELPDGYSLENFKKTQSRASAR